MPAKTTNPHAQTSQPDDHPKAYKQGQLDALCGVYAIINACRYMFKSAGVTKDLGAWELFTTLVDALDDRGRFATIACYGMNLRDHNCLLAATRKYLLGKHGLVLKIKRPLDGIHAPTALHAFRLTKKHLEHAGAVALLDFEAVTYQHWTVINAIYRNHLYLFDSTGMRPKPTSDFGMAKRRDTEPIKKFEFRKSGLLLLQIKKL